MKLPVVEEGLPTIAFLRRGLTEEDFAVDVAENAASATEQIALYDYDVILLDVMLPSGDGFDLCRRWRTSGLRTLILFLSARESITDRARGLNLGGDDSLVEPFAFEELLARVRVLVRRGSHGPALVSGAESGCEKFAQVENGADKIIARTENLRRASPLAPNPPREAATRAGAIVYEEMTWQRTPLRVVYYPFTDSGGNRLLAVVAVSEEPMRRTLHSLKEAVGSRFWSGPAFRHLGRAAWPDV